MSYDTLRDDFRDLLNHSLLTDNLVDKFVGQAVRRLDRILRIPVQESVATVSITTEGTTNVPIPQNYLGLVAMKINGDPCTRMSPTVQTSEPEVYSKTLFIRRGDFFVFPAGLSAGDSLEIFYYSEMSEASEGGYVIPETMYDLVLYGGLIFAAIHFVDDRKADYQMMYQELLLEVNNQAEMDSLSGSMSISPSHQI